MKKIRTVLFILIFIFCFSSTAYAQQEYSDDFRYSVQPEDSLLSEETDLNNPSSIKKDLEFKNIFDFFVRQLNGAFKSTLKVLLNGISLVLLSVLVNRCSGNIQNQNLQLLFSFIIALSIALMCENNLRNCAASLQKAIEDISIFSTACIPAFSVVMVAAGEGASATVFSTALVFLGEVGALVSKNVLMPLTDVYLSVGLCSAVSDEYHFSSLGKNIRKFVLWAVGIFVALFRMILRLQIGAASAGDRVTKKYIRTALGSLIPMVGNTLSEGVDGLFAVAAGVKTTFAIAGILIILSIMLPVLIQVGIFGFSWSICRWIADFLNDGVIRGIADVLANCFYLMLALGGSVALMGLFSFFGLIMQAV
jgi:stage III sporulation protein AE